MTSPAVSFAYAIAAMFAAGLLVYVMQKVEDALSGRPVEVVSLSRAGIA